MPKGMEPRPDPFEVLPGQWDDSTLVNWRFRAARPTRERLLALASGEAATGKRDALASSKQAWTRADALHLLRRTALGATPEAVDALLRRTRDEAVNLLIDRARGVAPLDAPDWIDDPRPPPEAPPEDRQAYDRANRDRVEEFEWQVYERLLGTTSSGPMAQAGLAFRERLALMWHDHFVTELDAYSLAPWLHRYWAIVRDSALGDVRTMVHDIGLTPAMLVYLNGADNRVGRPNENYARELLELFTMGIVGPDGQTNYTERDVQETSRALTGWSTDIFGDLDAQFVPEWHDTGQKRIFGERGRWGYDDVVPLLFDARGPEIAHYICRHLYRTFVRHETNENIVAIMASILIQEDWQIEPVLRLLLKSDHFFSSGVRGGLIKTPIEHTLGLMRSVGAEATEAQLTFVRVMNEYGGYTLFDPPDVSGWPGGRTWIDTNRLTGRWRGVDRVLTLTDLPAFVFRLGSPYGARALTAELAELLLGQPLAPEALDDATDVLLGGQPENEWDPGSPGANARLKGLVWHLGTLPEHQFV